MEANFSIPNFYVVLLVIPPIIFIFYGFIYQKQFAKELPMAVWDEDRSSVSRMLTDMMQKMSIYILPIQLSVIQKLKT
jgi:ABC-2 type transport system permease protein